MKTKDRFYQVEIEGERLLMHNEQLANPFNSYTVELSRFSKKRSKSIEDHMEVARIEFQGGLYFDEEVGPYVPDHCVLKMLMEGAKRRRLGTTVEQMVLSHGAVGTKFPLNYKGPRTRDGLWKARDTFADQRLVGIAARRILRTRPLFRDWKLPFGLRAIDGAVDGADIRTALEAAETIGLLDGRPRYGGTFRLTRFEEVKA